MRFIDIIMFITTPLLLLFTFRKNFGKFLIKSNNWYDKLKEPWRIGFLLIMLIALSFISCTFLGSESGFYSLLNIIFISIMGAWRVGGAMTQILKNTNTKNH